MPEQQVGNLIIRSDYVGDTPITNGRLNHELAAVLMRLKEIQNITVSGNRRGWHAVCSGPMDWKHNNFRRSLKQHGYVRDAGWQLKTLIEVSTDGQQFRSLWASYSGEELVDPPPIPQSVLHPPNQTIYAAPTPAVMPAPDLFEDAVLVEDEVEQPHPEPVRVGANIPRAPNPSGADPLAGLVFDDPPDLPPTISKQEGGATGQGQSGTGGAQWG